MQDGEVPMQPMNPTSPTKCTERMIRDADVGITTGSPSQPSGCF